MCPICNCLKSYLCRVEQACGLSAHTGSHFIFRGHAMKIYDAELHLKKLLAYVQDLAESKPNMYKKSKDRLKDISNTCNQVILLISDILQEELLNTADEDEFADMKSADISSCIDFAENEIDRLKKFSSTDQSQHVDNNTHTVKIPSEYKKHIMAKYGNTFLAVHEKCKNTDAEELSDILCRWFRGRFLESLKMNPNFRYSIKKIPNWIYLIVVAYGKHVANYDKDVWSHNFQSWIDSITSEKSFDKSVVPKDVYELSKGLKQDDLTLASVVVWDMLINSGLSEMCGKDDYGLMLDSDYIFNLCAKYNPSELDPYTDYREDPSVISLALLNR